MNELADTSAGLWTFGQDLKVMGAEIGARMTVVRLDGGGLLVHSPIRWTSELGRQLEALGPVRYVLVPNRDHVLFVRSFAERYPEARFYAAPGVAKKLPDMNFEEPDWGRRGNEPWGSEVEALRFRSSSELQEIVLFHRATRTLISADLAFNIQSSEGTVSRLLLRLNDSYKSFGPSRVCRMHITEPAMARADVDTILALGASRLVVSHGEILHSEVEAALRRGYAWMR
jgi:hypothetical protein